MKYLLLLVLLSLTTFAGPMQQMTAAFTTAVTGYNPATDATAVQWTKSDNAAVVATYANNDPVGTWTADKGKNATATTVDRPTFKTVIKNGLPAILFDGTANRMPTANFDSAISQPFAVALVASYTGAGFENRVAWCDNSFRVDINHWATGDTMAIFAEDGADNTAVGTDGAGWHIYIITFNGASSKYMVDGGTETTVAASPGAFGLTGMVLGGIEIPGFQYWTGYIGEVIVFNAVPDATAKGNIRTYLNSRWAVF